MEKKWIGGSSPWCSLNDIKWERAALTSVNIDLIFQGGKRYVVKAMKNYPKPNEIERDHRMQKNLERTIRYSSQIDIQLTQATKFHVSDSRYTTLGVCPPRLSLLIPDVIPCRASTQANIPLKLEGKTLQKRQFTDQQLLCASTKKRTKFLNSLLVHWAFLEFPIFFHHMLENSPNFPLFLSPLVRL